MHPAPNHSSRPPRMLTAHWIALLGPPLTWLLQFQARYALAGAAAPTAITLIAIAALILVAICALVGFRQWRHAGASPLDRWAGASERGRFMGALGLSSAGLFFLVIAAQLLAEFFVSPGKS